MDHERHQQITGFDRLLGLAIDTATADRVTGRIEVTPALHQPYGIVHGGVYSAVVETTASLGGALWFADRGQVVGVTNTTHFLRAVREGVLDVVATPLHRGRTQQLWQVFIHDGEQRLVSKGEVRLANLPHRDE